MVAESNNNEVAKVGEPLLDPNDDRFTMFPIKYGDIWEMYKKAEASFWTGTSPARPNSPFVAFSPNPCGRDDARAPSFGASEAQNLPLSLTRASP